MNGTDTDSREYPFDLGNTPIPSLVEVQNWLRVLLRGTTVETQQDVELVTTELLTNAYEHAAGPFGLRLVRPHGQELVRLEVDDGCPHLLPQSGWAAPNDRRGRGLLMVNGISSDWGMRIDTDRKTIWAEVPIVSLRA
jgi:hypothetical protein